MSTYLAFLRAINLGRLRKFPKADVQAVVESTGATGVRTHLNTGNVLLTSSRRSTDAVSRDLEAAFAADRGFEVPTIVLRPAELVAVAARADELWAELGEPASHYITLLKEPPAPEAVAAVTERAVPGEVLVVVDRAAHLLLQKGFHESRLAGSKTMERLGVGTARNVTVVRTLAERWCR